jgi:hypothetical protein
MPISIYFYYMINIFIYIPLIAIFIERLKNGEVYIPKPEIRHGRTWIDKQLHEVDVGSKILGKVKRQGLKLCIMFN